MALGKEDIMHKNFAQQMALFGIYKQLNKDCVWYGYNAAGEYRKPQTGALLKAKGLARGEPDYCVRLKIGDIMHHIYIEFKAGKNKQSEHQIEFEKTCEDVVNERYYLAYSVDEAISILEKEGVIKK